MSVASEKRFKDLVEITTDWVWEVDKDGVYTYVSPKIKELLGYEANEVLGRTPFDLMPAKEGENKLRFFQEKVAKKEAFYQLENINCHKDGHLVVLETNGIPIIDSKGQLQGYRGIDRDITERKKVEEALRESEEHLQLFMDSAVEGFVICDSQLNIVEINNTMLEWIGKSKEEATGKHILDVFPHLKKTDRYDKYIEVVRTGEPLRIAEVVIGSTSGNKHHSLTAFKVGDGLGIISRDITERKHAEEALRESEERFRHFFENEPAYCYMISPEGLILNVNNAALKALGYRKEELLGKSLKTIYAPDIHPKSRQLFAKWKKTGELKNEEMVIISKNGDKHTVLLSASAIRDKSGKILHSVSVQKDITEHKRVEQEIRRLNEELEQRVIDRTAKLRKTHKRLLQEIEERKCLEKEILDISEREQRRIGHELHDSIGQQLTGIAFMSKALEQKLAAKLLDEAADVAKIAELIRQAAEKVRGLAKGLHPVDLDAGTVMSALQELAASTEHMFGIRCSFTSNQPVPINETQAAVHLYRIAQEAVTNAIKHGKAKNIQIGLAYGVNESVLSIKSDGLDFPKELEAKGTGMGLQIMDHRAGIIGGTLDIRKAKDGGTIVTCTFPNKTTNPGGERNYGSEEKTAK